LHEKKLIPQYHCNIYNKYIYNLTIFLHMGRRR